MHKVLFGTAASNNNNDKDNGDNNSNSSMTDEVEAAKAAAAAYKSSDVDGEFPFSLLFFWHKCGIFHVVYSEGHISFVIVQNENVRLVL